MTTSVEGEQRVVERVPWLRGRRLSIAAIAIVVTATVLILAAYAAAPIGWTATPTKPGPTGIPGLAYVGTAMDVAPRCSPTVANSLTVRFGRPVRIDGVKICVAPAAVLLRDTTNASDFDAFSNGLAQPDQISDGGCLYVGHVYPVVLVKVQGRWVRVHMPANQCGLRLPGAERALETLVPEAFIKRL